MGTQDQFQPSFVDCYQNFNAQFPNLSQLASLQTPLPYFDTSSLMIPQLQLQTQIPQSLKDDLPYSVEILDDMIVHYFQHFSAWPINFLHPHTFISKRYHVSRSLLGIVCCRGSQFSKYTTMLKSMGEDPAEKLFQFAKRNFDVDESNIENIIAGFHLAAYAITKKRLKSAWCYFRVARNLFRSTKLYIDPDIIEAENVGLKFTLIEKETRRRLYWALMMLQRTANNDILAGLPTPNVKQPLPFHIFEALKETSTEQDIPLLEDVQYNLEPIAHEQAILRGKILQFQYNLNKAGPQRWNLLQIFIESLQLLNEFKLWYTQQPIWFQNILIDSGENIYVGSGHQHNKIAWLCPNIGLLCHTHTLFIFRFVLALIAGQQLPNSKYKVAVPEENKAAVEFFIQLAISECWDSHTALMFGLKNCLMRLDPNQEHTSPAGMIAVAHSAIFCSVMAEYASNLEQRLQARLDFEYIKKFYALAGKHMWGICETLLSDMERFDSTPSGDFKIALSQRLFTGSINSLEEYIEELGYYEEDKNSAIYTNGKPSQ
ncbi:hypothetical protein HK098_006742 [Nowakowskiella sp. JEL0407]|nr:hypothetical protein HK098_006742 [Nowakowskiella sp. JEL0407]